MSNALKRVHDSRYYAYLEGWVSVVANIFLFILKYWAGVATGSIAIIVDAWHTLSDSLSSIVVLFGVRLGQKPADKEHPFGHGRAEWIASLVIGMMLVVIALNFIRESWVKLQAHEPTVYGTFAIVATVVSILTKEAMAQFALWTSRITDSLILKADAWHHRSDAISSIIILVGIFFGPHLWWIDGVLGILVALMILWATWKILLDSVNPLLGRAPDPQLVEEVKAICTAISGQNVAPHHFHLHQYGDHLELTFHIRLHRHLSLDEAHVVSSKIVDSLRQQKSIEATIHIDPI